MAKSEREPLLVGLMLCIGSVVGLGMLLTMPAYSAWEAAQTQQKQLQTEIAQLAGQQQLLDQDIAKLSSTKTLPKDVIIRTSDAQHAKKNTKAMLDELIRSASQAGNQLISLLPASAANGASPPPAAPPPQANKTATPGTPGSTPSAANGAASGTTTPSATAVGGVSSAGTTPPATNPDGTPVVTAPPVPQLEEHGYDLAFRGTFDQVVNFLTRLDKHKELVEVTQVELKNEGGPQRQEYQSSAPYNRSKPIAMKLSLKLILQPDMTRQ